MAKKTADTIPPIRNMQPKNNIIWCILMAISTFITVICWAYIIAKTI